MVRFLMVLFVCVIFSISCDPEITPSKDYASTDAVTGLKLFDFSGQAIGVWREPNQKDADVRLFPNPNDGTFFLFSVDKSLEKLWIIEGDCFRDSISQDIVSSSQSLSYDEEDIGNLSLITTEIEDFQSQIAINGEELSDGFYKVFYKIDEELYWHNIYVNKTSAFPIEFSLLDNNCN